jgi:hypothetical protein
VCVPFVQRRTSSIRDEHRRLARAATLVTLSQNQLPTYPITPRSSNTISMNDKSIITTDATTSTSVSASPVATPVTIIELPKREPIFQMALLREAPMARFMWASMFICPSYCKLLPLITYSLTTI